jgi:hypothetical protein
MSPLRSPRGSRWPLVRLSCKLTGVANLTWSTGHMDAFMDTSQLSTLQDLLLLKARDIAPKRGYF